MYLKTRISREIQSKREREMETHLKRESGVEIQIIRKKPAMQGPQLGMRIAYFGKADLPRCVHQ